ncbi:MAG: hypothetical protein KA205_04770 [Acidobacteria bacterium]|nr:hypothetical protein [Acidobacteriota bacterium]
MRVTWTVGKKLLTGIGILVGLIIFSNTFTYVTEQAGAARFDTALERAHKIRLEAKIKRLVFELYAGEKILIMSGYDRDLKNYQTWQERNQATVAEFTKTADELAPLFTTPADQDGLKKVRALVTQWSDNNKGVVALIDEAKFHEAQLYSREKNRSLVDENNKIMDAMLDAQEAKLKEADVLGKQDEARSVWMILISAIGSLVVAGIVVWVVRGITTKLRLAATEMRQSAEQVVSASTQVASAAQSLSQGATEQAASIEETSASMEEVAAKTRTNEEHARQASALVAETDRAVQDSNAALTDMVQAMAGIRESSHQISKIIKTIDEIAFQTNILALNAAVEAARAGEAGMGFAVVADEVRNLAQRSAQAAKDTASLIEGAIERSQQGTDKVTAMGASVATITEKTQQVKGLMEMITEASREQTQGIDQVTQGVGQMEKVTQTTAATAEESAAASEELNAQAQMAMLTVAQLETMVGGTAVDTARTHAPKHHDHTDHHTMRHAA